MRRIEPLLLNANAKRVVYLVLEEIALLRKKDGFGEFSVIPKKPVYVSLL